jgi:ligand-binding sensor domain-containing protein
MNEYFLTIFNKKDMKNYIPIGTLLLLATLIFSCKGQQTTDQSIKVVSQPEQPVQPEQPKQPKINSPQIDSYLTVNKTITAPDAPSGITRTMIQDKKGDIWFATWQGIIHYDGTIFTNFTHQKGLEPFRVFTILEDQLGNLWFGTVGGGIYHYDGKVVTHFTTKDGLVNNRIGCFFEDKKGQIWIGTGGGISKYDGEIFTNFTTEDGLTNNDVNTIVEGKNGKLWFGTRGDACSFDGETFTKFTKFPKFTNLGRQSFENVRSIIKDKKDNLWFGGKDGLWVYDGILLTNLTKDFIGHIYEDKEGNIWTNSVAPNQWALSRYDKIALDNGNTKPTQIKVEKSMIFGILKDKEGSIWVGTLDGAYRYDGQSFTYFKDEKVKNG